MEDAPRFAYQWLRSERFANSSRRLRPLEGEIARLTDAVAQLGLSNALRATGPPGAGESRVCEPDRAHRFGPPPLPSPETIEAKIREVAVRLETGLS